MRGLRGLNRDTPDLTPGLHTTYTASIVSSRSLAPLPRKPESGPLLLEELGMPSV